MNTAFFIARRYILAKKSTNAINIISAVSMLGIMVGSAALIIILSVFNGFEHMVVNMFNTFTPSVGVSAAQGKFFNAQGRVFSELAKRGDVLAVTPVMEEKALLVYNNKQYAAAVKGVGDDYMRGRDFSRNMVQGAFTLREGGRDMMVIGSALQAYLGVNAADAWSSMVVYVPSRGRMAGGALGAEDLMVDTIGVAGVFEVQQEFDNTAIVPIAFMRRMMQVPDDVTGVEIMLKPGTDEDAFIEEVQGMLGERFVVRNRIQQHQTLYKMMRYEKWAVYMILSFILVIAVFNLLGSLIMLVIDKVRDIAILSSLGAGKRLVRSIFMFEGLMIAMGGCFLGLLLGGIFCVLQQRFGLIKMEPGFAGEGVGYPVRMLFTDFVLISVTVLSISLLATWLSARLSVKRVGKLANDL